MPEIALAAVTLVRALRTEAGLSQVQLALRSGLSLSSVRLAEYGLGITNRTAEKLAAALGVSAEQLRAPINGHDATAPVANGVHR